MSNGVKFHIKNNRIDNLNEWVKAAFMPGGVQKLWFEILPNQIIQISQIQEIKVMTDKEVKRLNKLTIN